MSRRSSRHAVRAIDAVATIATAAGIVAACGGAEPPPRAPPPTTPPQDPAWLARVASACAKIVSCSRGREAPRLRAPGACVDAWLERAESNAIGDDPLQSCVANAKSCEEVNACVHGGGDTRGAAFCGQRPGVVSGCDGDRLVSCGDEDAQESSVVDCAKVGASCREVKAASGLVIRACFSPAKCPAGAPETRCEGDAVLACRDGAIDRVVCKPGTRCEERRDEGGEPYATCALSGGRRCDMLGGRRCEDDRLVACHGRGASAKVAVSDCAGLGLRCAGAGPRAGCYVPANVECDKEMLARCEGDKLVFCAAGRLVRVACDALGLGPCAPGARGPAAACAAPPGDAAK